MSRRLLISPSHLLQLRSLSNQHEAPPRQGRQSEQWF